MQADPAVIYADLDFPNPPLDRPYTFMDMVATIDGKILSGARNESVADLGSKTDHMIVKKLGLHSDAVLVGAETVRASPETWDPGPKIRVVVSQSGNLPFGSAVFKGESYVASPNKNHPTVPSPIKNLIVGEDELDFFALMGQLKSMGIGRLLVLGGSHLNGELLRRGLVDELFLTIAPKVKLGDHVPTYAGGEAFSRADIPSFELLENHVVANEVFLRYRRLGRDGV